MAEKILKKLKLNRIRTKLIFPLIFMAAAIMLVNVFTAVIINDLAAKANTAYDSNRRLNEISAAAAQSHTALWEYLQTRGTQSLLNYYKNTDKLRAQAEALNRKAVNNSVLLLEKDVYYMLETYLEAAGSVVSAKRAQNPAEISRRYKEATTIYGYFKSNIETLNEVQLRENSEKYLFFADRLRWATYFCTAAMVLAIMFSIFMAFRNIFRITGFDCSALGGCQ